MFVHFRTDQNAGAIDFLFLVEFVIGFNPIHTKRSAKKIYISLPPVHRLLRLNAKNDE